MRIHGNIDRATANLTAGRHEARQRARAYRGEPLRPPAPGTVLKRIHVADCLSGDHYNIEIHQGHRRNSIVVMRDGKRITSRLGSGFDALFRMMRRDWKLRWAVEN